MDTFSPAPPLTVREWINTPRPLAIPDFAGRVLVIEAFQMLCPGCVLDALPRVQRISHLFDPREVAVIGLHTVFEHHAAQGSRVALEAFAHEYRLTFPIGIDAPGAGDLPQTMQAYEMRGTPTLILIDQRGDKRLQVFGALDDLVLGAQIGALLSGLPKPRHMGGRPGEGCSAPTRVREL